MQYVGSTSNEFKIRFRNHKSSLITKKRTCEVAIHFNKEPHALADFEFLIIEQLCNRWNFLVTPCLENLSVNLTAIIYSLYCMTFLTLTL